MWNRFDECRKELETLNYYNGIAEGSYEKLRGIFNSLKEKHKGEGLATLKSELIVALLENMTISVLKEDIFATHFNHYALTWELRSNMNGSEEFIKAQTAAKVYEDGKAMAANLDFGHVSPDWDYIISRGISGIVEDLIKAREENGDSAKYYDERIKVYSAIRDFLKRYSEYAYSLGTEKGNFIGDNLAALAADAPKTLAQGYQLILMFYTLQCELDTVTIRSLGGIDHLLAPLYRADLESGRYTKDQLCEITKYFLWKISCMKVTANLPFYICSSDEAGNDLSNDFTLFLLQTYRELDIYDPKIHVMYHEGMDKRVLSLILNMIREGKNSFVFINKPQASKALEEIGIDRRDAARVTVYGCYETSAEGTEVPCTCAGMVNLAKSLELALATDKQFDTFNDFYEEVLAQLFNYTVVCMDTIAAYERLFGEICPSMIMSPTYKNSRTLGIDLYSGGAKYNNTSIVGAALATLVDSLVAVKCAVYEKGLVTLNELREALNSDWSRNPKLRLTLKNKFSKFGNNCDEADSIAVDIFNRFADLINGRPNGRNGIFRCGMFSVDWRFWMGEKTAATPDGRCSGDPLSKNLTASIGQDKNGVTAYLGSLLKFDSTKTPDGYVADVVLHSSAVKGEEGMAAFSTLLHTFMKKGGFSVHFNILSPEMLKRAQREPEKYRNLQIRLCGWNVRFVDLDKASQDEFILQSTNNF